MAFILIETNDPDGLSITRASEAVKVSAAGPYDSAFAVAKFLLRLLSAEELQMLKAVLIPAAYRAIPQRVTEMAPPTDAELDRLVAEVQGGRAAVLANPVRM